jgi:hypothetical protein
MVGIAKRLTKGKVTDIGVLSEQYQELLNDQDYLSVANTATADEENVIRRLDIATRYFKDVP